MKVFVVVVGIGCTIWHCSTFGYISKSTSDENQLK